ncbi:hypothetical protein TRFO_10786 [Tritrichomonas foetus]|uniref:Uncharacterized protein n=1 Tax=Tritrichomonas foetus TaxID=1144522 RepID=A0A1J4J6L7_9EUKA|nr:hypothetical protein TRFO_10786 [Tritrichomonas foetus]|eukprot:OHS94866.1 hypothetical protein TRFO_10786 [Tritrichomonas foetus]
MKQQCINDLKLEYKKFSRFMIPDVVRGPATEALRILSEDEIKLPINDPQHPVITAFSIIVENKKTRPMCPPLINTICDCLRIELITGDALSSVIRRIESFDDIDDDMALKIIQFSTAIIVYHYLDMHIFQSILSLLGSFCSSQSDLVSTSSIAAINQIISSFFSFAEEKCSDLTVINKRDIDLCYSMAGGISVTFDNHIQKVIFLVLRDFIQVCCGQKSQWLRIHQLKSDICFGVLENAIVQHFGLIVSSKHFLNLIEKAIKSAYSQNAPLSFCILSIEILMDTLPSACAALFSYFLSDLKPHSPKLQKSLTFYRILLFRNSSVVVNFCLKCDQNANLLSGLISALRELSEHTDEDLRIDLSLSNRASDWTPGNDPSFVISAPIEITIFFVVSCYKAANSALKILVSHTWGDVLLIFQVGSSIVTGRSCYVLMQGLHSLAVLTNELMLDDARGSAIGAFCTILVAPKGPEADEIRKTAYLTVFSAIETTPAIFRGHWNKLMTALSEFHWKPQNFLFTLELPEKQVIEIALSLFSINDGNATTREWSMTFFSDLLIENMNRFGIIWDSLEENIFLSIVNKDSQIEALNSLFSLLNNGFTKESEFQLSNLVQKLFDGKYFDPETRYTALEQIYLLLSKSGNIIEKGWPSLINALNPKNFEDEVDVLNSAFRCLQLIYNDLLFSLSTYVQALIINLAISFAGQKTDINVSLSAFGLLWNLSSVAKNSDMWKLIFKQAYPLIGDPRNDVSLCAVNTFFSLIISNSQVFEPEVFRYIAEELVNPVIDILVEERPECESSQQSAFHELAHCGRNLWNQFSPIGERQEEIWKRLIIEHEKFMMRCTKREVVTTCFQFYDEVFQCNYLSDQLFLFVFDSLDRLKEYLIAHETANSPLYGAFGRMIRNSVPAQKSRMNMTFLKRWISIIESLIFDLNCGSFLPPTSHKTLDALDLLFPLPEDQTFVVYESIVKIACYKTEKNRLTEVAVGHLCDICENKVPKELLSTLFIMSKGLFKMKEARKLVLDFVSNDIPIVDDMVESVCSSLMNLGQSDNELTEKTAESVLKLFLRISDETKLKFIESYSTCYQALFALWKRYLDPTSEEFDENSALLCMKKLNEILCEFLTENSSDEDKIVILKFICETQSYGKCFESEKKFAHIYFYLDKIADLILSENMEIRKLLREIVLIVSHQQ